jgi:hypothetical protein
MIASLKRHWFLSSLGLLILLLAGFIAWRAKGPYRSYRVNVHKPGPGDTTPVGDLQVGLGMRDITPDLSQYDSWVDADGDAKYNPDKGDTYADKNGNGKFDAVWMAGFSNNRPAKGVHDPLWARAIALKNNGVTVVMVTYDSIGIFHEVYIDIRKRLNQSLGIDHVMFSCLHNHETPDTMGIWSYSIFPPQIDWGYLEKVDTILSKVVAGPEGYVDDSRLPIVYDNTICCARFVKKATDETVATLVEWGNHVETLASGNSLLTSDFAHYWREGVENGVPDPKGCPGLGGKCLYFQGQVGGLMTQLHTTVPHRNGTDQFKEGSFEKAQALGENLAILTVGSLKGADAWRPTDAKVAVCAKTVFVPISGLFQLGGFLGLVHPGWFWGKGRSEIDVIRIGEIEILTIPGELYPEIGNGGVEAPQGADFGCQPIEVPPLRSRMKGKLNMIVGLANDELGYFVPKSQWDVIPPYAYGRDKPQYGEVNSPGPAAAGAVHKESIALLEQMHNSQ